MNIVNLIEKLQEVLAVHGNINVYADIPPEDKPDEGFLITRIVVEDHIDTNETSLYLSSNVDD